MKNPSNDWHFENVSYVLIILLKNAQNFGERDPHGKNNLINVTYLSTIGTLIVNYHIYQKRYWLKRMIPLEY